MIQHVAVQETFYWNDSFWHIAEVKAWHHAGFSNVRFIWQRTVVPPNLFCPRTTLNRRLQPFNARSFNLIQVNPLLIERAI
jgi:hypothetical protein